MKLTITASNRDRLKLNDNASQWFLKSIQWQDYDDFELLIADGGSQNYEELKHYFESSKERIPMRIVQHKIGIPFERALLNNVGIRNAKGDYVMCTDVDMVLGKDFAKILMKNAGDNILVESRTMYWKQPIAESIYKGERNPYNDLDACKVGRIKKRTSAGGCQCMKKTSWEKIHGFSESFIGWGSEDYDLLTRAQLAGFKVVWMGENNDIMLFHQPHPKNVIEDLKYQENNKKILAKIKSPIVNPNGWGGING